MTNMEQSHAILDEQDMFDILHFFEVTSSVR